ncbi:MAG TPA: DUF3040 domain-containing protein [Streptosporangiaceae bacterium]
MPLSEHEQRQLEQIEQALYAEHPRFARRVRASDPRVHYRRRVFQAAIGFLVGVGLLVGGVATKNLWIGVAGFVVMLACCMWALSSYRHMSGITAGRGLASGRGGRQGRPSRQSRRQAKAQSQGGVMDRLEERWRRRQERDR